MDKKHLVKLFHICLECFSPTLQDCYFNFSVFFFLQFFYFWLIFAKIIQSFTGNAIYLLSSTFHILRWWLFFFYSHFMLPSFEYWLLTFALALEFSQNFRTDWHYHWASWLMPYFPRSWLWLIKGGEQNQDRHCCVRQQGTSWDFCGKYYNMPNNF